MASITRTGKNESVQRRALNFIMTAPKDIKMRAFHFAICIMAWLLGSTWTINAQIVSYQSEVFPSATSAILTNACQGRGLLADVAAKRLPVHLHGIMVDTADGGPTPQSLILLDGTAAIYVRSPQALDVHAGDLLEIDGVTGAGQFAPIVIAATIHKTGSSVVPPAQPVSYQQLITGALGGQWVEIRGVVR